MTVACIDHIAITVADVDRTLRFYERVLGAESLYEDLWKSGKIPVALLQVGASRLSVHDAARPAKPHAHAPAPGAVDLCFRWEGTVDSAAAHLAACGVAVIEGPAPRQSADGKPAQSVYFRDPDENLLELLAPA